MLNLACVHKRQVPHLRITSLSGMTDMEQPQDYRTVKNAPKMIGRIGSEMCRANSEQDRLGPVSHIKIDKFHFV